VCVCVCVCVCVSGGGQCNFLNDIADYSAPVDSDVASFLSIYPSVFYRPDSPIYSIDYRYSQ
jgi:hypothetical protein